MEMYSNIYSTATLLGDTTRVRILMGLMDGCSLPAGELARLAKVSPQTASSHLTKLVEGGLLNVVTQGRHRYYQLANPSVARAIESLVAIHPPVPVRSLRQSDQMRALQFARTCYDHLAGELGVALTRSLIKQEILTEMEEGYQITPRGVIWFTELKIPANAKKTVPYHIDWTQRVHHMAGPLSVVITNRFIELGWIAKGRIRRSILLTELGRKELYEKLQLEI